MYSEQQVLSQLEALYGRMQRIATGRGTGTQGQQITVVLDQPLGNIRSVVATCYTPCPPPRVMVLQLASGEWIAIGSNLGQPQETDVSQFRRHSPEPQTGSSKLAILFARTLTDSIEFWIGGDRPTPIKVTTIPRRASIEELAIDESYLLAYTHIADGGQGTGQTGPTYSGYIYYQPTFALDAIGSATVTGFNQFSATVNVPIITEAKMTGVIGATADAFNAFPSVAPGVVGVLNATDNYTGFNEPLDIPLFYSRPTPQTYLPLGAINRSSIAEIKVTPLFAPPGTIQTIEASLTLNEYARIEEFIAYKAYLTATPEVLFMGLSYNIRQSGYATVRHFKVAGQVSELEEPNNRDWRKSIANSAVNAAPSGEICIDTYRYELTTNLVQNMRYSVDWNQPIVTPTGPVPFHQYIRNNDIPALTVQVYRIAATDGQCTSTLQTPITPKVFKLDIDPDADNITYIAAVAVQL